MKTTAVLRQTGTVTERQTVLVKFVDLLSELWSHLTFRIVKS